jgi:REP element-mobilizing transposase RayT
VLQVLKQKVSRRLRREGKKRAKNQLVLPFREEFDEAEYFWQRRFCDFNVWSEKKVKEKLNYMHANPVQRKLVKHPKEWPWSSWMHYTTSERGLIAIDLLKNETMERENPHP